MRNSQYYLCTQILAAFWMCNLWFLNSDIVSAPSKIKKIFFKIKLIGSQNILVFSQEGKKKKVYFFLFLELLYSLLLNKLILFSSCYSNTPFVISWRYIEEVLLFEYLILIFFLFFITLLCLHVLPCHCIIFNSFQSRSTIFLWISV